MANETTWPVAAFRVWPGTTGFSPGQVFWGNLAAFHFPLMQTGLVVRRGGDLAFVHDTFREFLAAEAFATTYTPRDAEAWNWVVRWINVRWREPVRFLLEVWSDEEQDVTDLLEWIYRPFGTDVREGGVVFVASTLALGLSVAAHLADHVASSLLQGDSSDYYAFRAISDFRHLPRIQTGAMELLKDPAADSSDRLRAAQILGDLQQGEVAVPALRALLEDEEAPLASDSRQSSAWESYGRRRRCRCCGLWLETQRPTLRTDFGQPRAWERLDGGARPPK